MDQLDGSYITISPGAKSCINVMEIRPVVSPIAEYLDEQDSYEQRSWLTQKASQLLLSLIHIFLHCLFSRQKTARVKHKAVFRAIRNVSSAKQLPEGICRLRSFSRQMGIFQLARKVSAMVGSRAPKPSAASAGYRHETA